MNKFEEQFNSFIPELTKALSIPNSTEWTVKGFIDYYKNIYSISADTKVVSKIIELMIFPKFIEFAKKYNYEMKLSPHQNYYPDMTFIDGNKNRYAVDLKSTYRVSESNVNGMTLGAFTGYFRNRDSKKNVLYPYGSYEKHYVFGIIYSRSDIYNAEEYFRELGIALTATQKKELIAYMNDSTEENWNEFLQCLAKKGISSKIDKNRIDAMLVTETDVYNMENYQSIRSVVRDFDYFIQEKWRLAVDRPGSGNTKNIGSESKIEILKKGTGLFYKEYKEKGIEVFDSYWTNYETKEMAKADGKEKASFNNLESYKKWVDNLKK